VTKDGDQIALAAGFDAQHAEPVLFVVKGDALDEPGEELGWRARPWRLGHHGMMQINIPGATGIKRRQEALATGKSRNQRCRGTVSRAGATLGTGKCMTVSVVPDDLTRFVKSTF
jgi:hypothetical protein